MSELIRLYIKSAICGFLAAGVFVGLVLWLNIANLGHLVSTSDVAIMATVVFWILNGIVFSGVQFAWGITAMADDPDDTDRNEGGGGPGIPVLVEAKAGKTLR